MSVVDELEIELTANAKKANTSIDNLVSKLDTLSGSLSKIDGSRLSGLANGVSKLGLAAKTLSGVKATDYNRIAKGFERFAKIDASKFSSLSSGLNSLAKGINAIGSVQNLGNITPSINAIKNLARVDMSGFDTSKLQSIANTMSSFATQLSGVGKIEGSVTRLVSSMARLSSSGQYIGNVAMYFPQLGNQVVALVGKLSSAGAIDSSIAKIVDGIARLASAGKKIQVTVANLDKLGDGVVNLLNRLKNAPQINANIANTIQGLGNLASSGSRISTVTGNASGGTKRFGNALRSLKDRLQGAHKSSKGLASSIGMFYAKFFLVIRAVKKFGEALGSAQDYIEEFNYFSVALDKIGKDSAKQFKKAGYNSAEEYAKSFRSRFSKLQTQLTGYKVDYDTGDATSQMTHNLGLDLTKVMNFNAAIAQITNSAGMLGETSIMTSKALTMLSADWSSLSNQDLSKVMDNMQSALIGQSRAVYKYGIDITNAGLAQTALNHGIKVNISSLDQQSKMQLRALTMLEQSKVAYGDLARTINQPANQLRMLQAGFKNLARTIGSLFMPIVQKLYPYLNAMVMVLQEFAQWIAKLAGIKLGDVEGGFSTPDYSDAVDDSDKIADNMDKTAKKTKKAADNLQGFDVINKLQGSDNDGGGTDGGTGKGQGLDLSKELANALGNYEKIWNKAFKDNQNKAVQLANKIKKALIDGWKKGDFSDVGKAFAQKINGALAKIPWAKIKETTKKIAKSIATFLNGEIDGLDWALVGKTISEGFNTATDMLYTFVTTFNWLKFGQGIATGLNSTIANYDWSKLGKTLGTSLRGIIQTAFGAVTNFDFTQFGKKIGDAINGFFEDMGNVDERTGLTGWQEFGKTISDSIKGILDTINTALSTVKWSDVGKSIGQFLGSIDWIGIIGRVGSVIANALFSAFKVAVSTFITDPIGMVETLGAVFTTIFAVNKLKGIKDTLKNVFKNCLSDSLRDASSAFSISGVKGLIGTKLGKIGTIAISLTLAVESIKWASGQWENIFDKYTQEEVSESLKEMFKDAFNSVPGKIATWFATGGLVGTLADKIVKAFSGKGIKDRLSDGIAGVFEGIGTIVSGKYSPEEWLSGIYDAFSELPQKISGYAKDIVEKAKPWFTKEKWSSISSGIKGGIKAKWDEMKNWFKDTALVKWWGDVKSNFAEEKWGSNIASIKSAFSEKWGDLKEWWENTAIVNWWEDVKEKFSESKWSNAFSGLKDGLKGVWEGAISSVKGVWNTFAKWLNEKLSIDIPKIEIAGKKLFDGKKINLGKLPTFKTGGFPEDGLFFANHNEMVGQFSNGKTAVANNDQIVKGIAEGIGPVVYAAMKQAISEMPQQGGGDVYLDTTKVTKEIMGKAEQISRSRGSGWKLA